MRVLRYLCGAQLARLGCGVGGLWIAAGVAGVALQSSLAGGWSLDSAGAVLALPFVDVARIVAPLALGHHVVWLLETGEWNALRSAGVGPWRAVLALLAPWLVCVGLISLHTHRVAPALTANVTDVMSSQAFVDDERLAAAMRAVEVPVVGLDGSTRLLMPDSRGVLAIEFVGAERVGDVLRIERARWSRHDGDGLVAAGDARDVELQLPPIERPLSGRSERELSTAFLSRAGHVWSKARAKIEPFDGLAAVERELVRRRAIVPALLLALLLAIWPLLRPESSARFVWLSAVLPALLVGVGGPAAASGVLS